MSRAHHLSGNKGSIGRAIRRAAYAAALAVVAGGCANHEKAQPLSSDSFLQQSNSGHPLVEDSSSTLDRPTPAPAGVSVPAGQERPALIVHSPRPVTPQTLPASEPSSAAPATERGGGISGGHSVGASVGQYLILGDVVAEVNGAPIYANRVLDANERALREKASVLDAGSFQRFASDLIHKRVQELIHDELEFATADRLTSSTDKLQADAMTQEWRKQQIRAAGGSLAVTRSKAREASGEDFDEMLKEQYRSNLIHLYYQKKVFPKIQITADDLRSYYDRNKETEFTSPEMVKFRIIMIDPERSGGHKQGMEKAIEKLERLRRGEDFAAMASKENDNKTFADNAGFPAMDWMGRKSFIEPVEDAVWKLKPGQVGDIIDIGTAIYIVKLEERKDGAVRPFEDQGVQDLIHSKLQSQQFNELRAGIQSNLEKNAVIRVSESMIQNAVDMAMQKYAQWAGSPGSEELSITK